LFCTQHILKKLNEVAASQNFSSFIITTQSSTEHDTLKHNVIFGETIHELILQELNNLCVLHELTPSICGSVNHCSKQLEHQISVLATGAAQFNVVLHVGLKNSEGARVELADVATHLEKESVLEFECALYQKLVLVVLGYQLCIARVCGEVYG
jgi:sulfite reductase beta subunit-like hemoprotein